MIAYETESLLGVSIPKRVTCKVFNKYSKTIIAEVSIPKRVTCKA